MKRPSYWLALAGLVLIVGGSVLIVARHRKRREAGPKLPSSLAEFKQMNGGAATVDAGEFVIGLAKEGKLPGFAKGEHGSIQAGIVDGSGKVPSGVQAYPISRGIHVSKEGDDADYFYVVVLETNGASWKLQKAWRDAADGRRLSTYAVP